MNYLHNLKNGNCGLGRSHIFFANRRPQKPKQEAKEYFWADENW